jgi:hypothetical protein
LDSDDSHGSCYQSTVEIKFVDTGGRQRLCGKYFTILELAQLIEEAEKQREGSWQKRQ